LSIGRSIRCSAQAIGHTQTLYVMLKTWYLLMYFGDYCYVLLMVGIQDWWVFYLYWLCLGRWCYVSYVLM
jgi:hypothetical protein